MIKLTINKYRNFTEEEIEAQKKWQQANNNYGYSRMELQEQINNGINKYLENTLEVQITDEQFEAIRKAVLENF